jgi:hypothetical protein
MASAAAQRRVAALARRQRDKAEKHLTTAFAREVSGYLEDLWSRLETALRRRGTKDLAPDFDISPGDLDIDRLLRWPNEEAALGKIVKRHTIRAAEAGFADVSGQLGVTVAFDLNSRGMSRVIGDTAGLVKGITNESRDRLRTSINAGIDAGQHPRTIARGLLEQAKGWAGLEDLTRSRAFTIARTETGFAYNWATHLAYKQSGLVEKVLCLDNPACGWKGHNDASPANNSERTLQEMRDVPLSHPNCVRAFAPIVRR